MGFKKGHRTSDNVFVLNTIVKRFLKVEKRKLYVAFIDFRKAYDKINRNLLFLKLQRLGVKGLLYQNIKAIYKDISYLIKVRGGYLEPISSTCGLKQGGVLSPLLFNIFVDEIIKIFDDTCDPVQLYNDTLSHMLYADDLILLSTSKDGLSNCLSRLEKFCDTWQLEVNIKKSKIVIFNEAGRLITGTNFLYRKMKMEIVRSYCYLGIEFTCSGSFKQAREILMDKAQKAVFPLKSVINQFQLPCVKSLGLFHSLITPIALYNSENLAHLTHRQIKAVDENQTSILNCLTNSYVDKTQQKFLKYILGVKRNCNNMATLGELGEHPLLVKAWVSLLSFWHRSTQMPDETLTKRALQSITESDSTHSEWIATVKFLLKELNLSAHFQNPNDISTEKFVRMCKDRLGRKFIQQWQNLINSQDGRLRFFKLFKHTFERESYLDNLNCFQLRKTVSKFRCSDHRLEVEVGRHKNTPAGERICQLCRGNTETETHFLTECPLYTRLRIKYLGYNVDANLNNIVQCKNKTMAFNLANFLTKAFELRKRMLEIQAYFK